MLKCLTECKRDTRSQGWRLACQRTAPLGSDSQVVKWFSPATAWFLLAVPLNVAILLMPTVSSDFGTFSAYTCVQRPNELVQNKMCDHK